MSSFGHKISPAVKRELAAASLSKNANQQFAHLERAHVLGQTSTYWHLVTHARMARWAIRNRSGRELVGQLTRIVGATVATPLGWIPIGNTGGSNVSPFKVMPIPADLAAEIESARRTS
jgi:Protein of unknown function (DUF3703)